MAKRTSHKRKPPASFGSVRKLPSGKWQARYTGADLIRRAAPGVFDTKGDGEGWIAAQRTDLDRATWQPPRKATYLTFGEYAEQWLADRELKPRTRELYANIYRRHLHETFAGKPLVAILPADVKRWHTNLGRRLTRAAEKAAEDGKRVRSGATTTLAELMNRLGHSTPQAALIYQHAAAGRDAVIAAKLSEIAGGAK